LSAADYAGYRKAHPEKTEVWHELDKSSAPNRTAAMDFTSSEPSLFVRDDDDDDDDDDDIDLDIIGRKKYQ